MTFLVNRISYAIEWGHCGPSGQLLADQLFGFLDTGTWRLFEAALSLRTSDIGAAYGIIGFPLVAVGARFHAPIVFGDVVGVASTVGEFRRASFDVRHTVSIGAKTVAEGEETRVWTTRDKDEPSRIKSLPIPQDVIDRFRSG